MVDRDEAYSVIAALYSERDLINFDKLKEWARDEIQDARQAHTDELTRDH